MTDSTTRRSRSRLCPTRPASTRTSRRRTSHSLRAIRRRRGSQRMPHCPMRRTVPRPGASYVAGQVALAAGDVVDAIKKGKAAVDKDPRPLYAVGLALRTPTCAASAWPEASASLDRASAVVADQPSAVIERAIVVARSGKVATDPKLATDTRSQLAKLIGDPSKKQPASRRHRSGLAFSRSRSSTSHATIRLRRTAAYQGPP